jgi:hypothetical protein
MKKDRQENRIYQIEVEGRLDASWSDWFDNMTVELGCGDGNLPVTTLTGPVADQATLRGILTKLWDLNLRLISILPIKQEKEK